MNFISVSLKNFKSYPDFEQTIPLNHEGIKLIVANNGAGKSTIFEAIIWCLYGKTSQDSVDDVVNRYTKKNCKVNVIFSINGVEYSVFRYRNHETHGNALYLFKNDENISLKNIQDTQQLIQDIIQIPYQAFVNSIIFSTDFYSSFFQAKPNDRLKIFESILSLKEVSVLYELNKKKIQELNEKISYEESEKGMLEASFNSIKEANEAYLDGVKAKLLEFKEEKKSNEQEIEKLKSKIEEYSSIDITTELSNIETEEKNKEIRNAIEEEKRKLINIESIKSNIAFLQTSIENLSKIDIQKEIESVKKNKEIDTKILELTNTKNTIYYSLISTDQTSNQLKKLQSNKEKANKELESIKNNRCYACGQLLEKEKNKELLETKQKEIESIDKELKALQDKIDEANANNEKINAEIKDLDNQITTLKNQKNQTSFTEESIQEYQNKLSKFVQEKAIKEKELDGSNKFNNEINDKITKLENQLVKTSISQYNKDFLINLQNIIAECKNSITELENKNKVIDKSAKTIFDKNFIENNEKKLKEYKEQVNEKNNLLNQLKETMMYYQVLSTIFSNKESGFKKYFINKMIDVFNETLNFYLPFFFEKDIKVFLDKDLNETIEFDKMKVTFNSFSSGQKTRVDIATSFALFNLVKVFFSNDTNLIVMDELLDKHIDNDGFDAVVDVINGMAKDNTIFIVSHREELKERFTDKIEIVLEDNTFSKVII